MPFTLAVGCSFLRFSTLEFSLEEVWDNLSFFMFRLFRFLPTRWWSPKAWKTWRAYMHWRLETYGVYDPAGQTDKTVLRSLIRQFPSYYRWLGQIGRLRNR